MAIDILPAEVLNQILQYLNVSDKAVLSQTCRALRNASTLVSAVTLGDNAGRIMNSLRLNECDVRRYTFEAVDFQQMQVQVQDSYWTSMGADVTSLHFRRCQISERTFVGIVCRCPRLRHLLLDECNSLFMSGKLLDTRCMDVPLSFRSITHLEIVNNRYLSDALFNRLVGYQSSLVKLSLAGCPISFHAAIFKRFYPANGSVLASESVLTFQNVLKCVQGHARSLKCLDLSHTLIDDQALTALSAVPDLSLEDVVLSNCYQLSDVGIEALCSTQLKLRLLNVHKCPKLSDRTLHRLTTSSTLIEKLNICDCVKVSDDGLALLSSLPKLTDLDVSVSGRSVSSLGLERALCGAAMAQLTTLNVSACPLSEASIVVIVAKLTQLRHLDLSNCCDGVTDLALHALTLNLRWLRSLLLAGCKNITDYGLTGCHYKVPAMSPASSPTANYALGRWVTEEVSNGHPPSPDEPSMTDFNRSSSNVSLSRLSGLVKLDLSGCSLISDISLKVAIRFRELCHLDVSVCHRITDSGALAIGAFNASLETLKLNQCRNLTDFGVVALVKSLPRLKHLDIQGCQKIGNESVEAVGRWCPSLRFLDVSICPGIASQTLVALEKKMDNLHLNQRQLSRSEFAGTLYQTSTFSKIKG